MRNNKRLYVPFVTCTKWYMYYFIYILHYCYSGYPKHYLNNMMH